MIPSISIIGRTAKNLLLSFSLSLVICLVPLLILKASSRQKWISLSDNVTSKNRVILYLLKGGRESEIAKSISLAHLNMKFSHPYPILIFHTGDYDYINNSKYLSDEIATHLKKNRLDRKIADRIEYHRINFSIPKGISNNVSEVNPVSSGNPWPGYNQMCQFFMTDIFFHPRLLGGVKYYLRLDSDSYVLSSLCEDPFDVMEKNDKVYGYKVMFTDSPQYIQGMYDFVDNYANRHPDLSNNLVSNEFKWPPKDEYSNHSIPILYNNFEIVKLDAFRKKELKDFYDEIKKKPERIFKYRWGDAPMRYVIMNLFFNFKNDSLKFCEFEYEHQLVWSKECECSNSEQSGSSLMKWLFSSLMK